MKQHKFIDDKDRAIRISWAINNAVEELASGDNEWERVERTPFAELEDKNGPLDLFSKWDKETIKHSAEKYLDLFDEMDYENNYCLSCGGLASNKEPVRFGMHPACRVLEENIKVKQL